ncbi:hypothetical protein DU500_03795 [Haloplanus rubicundus]|uniref:Uncharacterized protein n=1 Tax=Haloplanus rubicundus TaxID=1547898 RepID=A0A345E0A4_9EURY|nr:hypothetical protein DU500_03795 [Haloplanus rubicundus]
MRRYALPKERERTFWTDTSQKGFSVKWEVSDEFDAGDFEDFVRGADDDAGAWNAIAAFRGRNSRISGSLDDVTEDEAYPTDCTYLRVEADHFDVDWLAGSYTNRIIFSANPERRELLGSEFYRFSDEYGDALLDRPYRLALQQAKQVIERDSGFEAEFDLS